jgi:hypothetical protein
MQLAYIQPLFWLVPTVPEGYVYHINFPGPDIMNPVFVVTKGTPTDQSGMNFHSGTVINIGSFPTFSAAQMACENDFSGTAQRVVWPLPSPSSPNQPVQPVDAQAPVNATPSAASPVYVEEAPLDGKSYVRNNGGWLVSVPGEAPTDGQLYGRKSSAWALAAAGP